MIGRSGARGVGLVLAIGVSMLPGALAGQPPAPPGAGPSGEVLFATMCGWCHQSGGRAAGKGPKLAGTQQSDADLINRIKNGKPGAMPAYGSIFTDEQIRAIVGYIRSLEDGR
jgi:mono/diheme cytochrome c family protein